MVEFSDQMEKFHSPGKFGYSNRDGKGLTVTLPATKPCDIAFALRTKK